MLYLMKLTAGFGVNNPTAIKMFVGTNADNLNGMKIFSFVSGWIIASFTIEVQC